MLARAAALLIFALPAAAETRALQGFDFSWTKRPHRVNRIAVAPAGAAFQGGSWADGSHAKDTAHYAFDWALASSPELSAWDGESPALEFHGAYPGPPAAGQARVELSLSRIGLAGAAKVAVILRGFELDTDVTHEDGYTTRGMGVGLEDVSLAGDALTFVAKLRLEAAAVPDRNQRLKTYGATGRVLYTVVALKEGAVTTAARSYTFESPAGVEPRRPHAPEALQDVVVQGRPNLALGVAALTGFEFELNLGARPAHGRYLREISVRLRDFAYDAASGRMGLKCDGYFSNSGALSAALASRFSVTFVLLQAPTGTVSYDSETGALP